MKQINKSCLVPLLNLPKLDLFITQTWFVFLFTLVNFNLICSIFIFLSIFLSFCLWIWSTFQLFFPTSFQDHWFVFIVDIKDRKYVILDSFYKQNDEFQEIVRDRLVSILCCYYLFYFSLDMTYDFHIYLLMIFLSFFYTEILLWASLGQVHAS